MNHLKVTILIVAAVWCFVSLTATSYAEQRAIGPKQIQQSVPVAATQAPVPSMPAIKPLQQSLMLHGSLPPLICPSLINTLDNIIQLTKTDIPAANQMYGSSGDVDFPGDFKYYRNYVQDCCSPNKSFSVQDQKNAGCAGSDSVNLCMDKVIKYCFNQFPDLGMEKIMVNKSVIKSNAIIIKTKQLNDNLNQLLKKMQ